MFYSNLLPVNIPDRRKFTVWTCIGLVVLISLLDLNGWIFGWNWFKGIEYYWIPMHGAASVCFLISSIAVLITFSKRPAYIKKTVTVIAGVVLNITSAFTIISWTGTGAAQDGFLSNTFFLNLFFSPEQGMPLLSAYIFLFTGVILILLALDNQSLVNIAHILLFPVSIAAYLIPLCYLLDIYSIPDFFNAPVGLNSGISFCALCFAIYLSRTDTWFMEVYASKSMGGIMARRLFPWLIIIPVLIGRLRIYGEQTGLFDSITGVLIVAITYTFCFIILIWITARSLNLIDSKRMIADEALKKSYADLEDRVKERTDELLKMNRILEEEIRERINAENIAASERKRNLGLLEIMPVYIILLTPDHHVSYSNKFFRERFGYSAHNKCYQFLFGRSEPCEICETYKVFDDNLPHTWEWKGPDGHIYSIYDFPYTDSDGSPLIMEMGIDITILKEAESKLVTLNAELEKRVKERTRELETSNYRLNQELIERHAIEESLKESEKSLIEMNTTKDKFLNIIAHDLKNPFTCLIGITELLSSNIEKMDPESIKELAMVLNDSAKSGFEVLRNLLDWSRSQIGLIKYSPEKLNLKRLIDGNISDLKLSGEKKHIRMIDTVNSDLEIFADKNMLNSVLRNLLANAIKFTHNSGTIEVSASVQHKGVKISVKDNGIGISEEQISGLFRIETLVTKPGTNLEHGTGLGLKICKEFVEIHGGRIWVNSTLNEGSEFVFTIPG